MFFGAGKLPQLGSSLGSGIKNFKKAMNGQDGDEDDDEEIDVTPKKKKKKAIAASNTAAEEEEDDEEPAKAEAIRPK